MRSSPAELRSELLCSGSLRVKACAEQALGRKPPLQQAMGARAEHLAGEAPGDWRPQAGLPALAPEGVHVDAVRGRRPGSPAAPAPGRGALACRCAQDLVERQEGWQLDAPEQPPCKPPYAQATALSCIQICNQEDTSLNKFPHALTMPYYSLIPHRLLVNSP